MKRQRQHQYIKGTGRFKIILAGIPVSGWVVEQRVVALLHAWPCLLGPYPPASGHLKFQLN